MRNIQEQIVISLISYTLEVDPAVITPDTHLIDDLQATKADLMSLYYAIEEELCISINLNIILNCRTVRDVINVFEKHSYFNSKLCH